MTNVSFFCGIFFYFTSMFNLWYDFSLPSYIIFDTCSDASYAELSFNAFEMDLKFFSNPPELPVMTFHNTFIGGMSDAMTEALGKVGHKAGRIQVRNYTTGQHIFFHIKVSG